MDTKKRATPYDAELEQLEETIFYQASETAILDYHYLTCTREGYLLGFEDGCSETKKTVADWGYEPDPPGRD